MISTSLFKCGKSWIFAVLKGSVILGSTKELCSWCLCSLGCPRNVVSKTKLLSFEGGGAASLFRVVEGVFVTIRKPSELEKVYVSCKAIEGEEL